VGGEGAWRGEGERRAWSVEAQRGDEGAKERGKRDGPFPWDLADDCPHCPRYTWLCTTTLTARHRVITETAGE
jgi:hypothetical protein